eukprot:CAMPEP_0170821616 /NCGR_PEP_ID=MMETSP0733-20121128/43183_1 /TAXON_ID=186038 /ORGANISM="Fragilariopsis kerguelensis, Strain L26-C5" /LENGTH=340 /DNA_ID=CAMNT_0011183445 /DNA_START=95 /DNA_END=1117 /DNA_ORIENTATION=+
MAVYQYGTGTETKKSGDGVVVVGTKNNTNRISFAAIMSTIVAVMVVIVMYVQSSSSSSTASSSSSAVLEAHLLRTGIATTTTTTKKELKDVIKKPRMQKLYDYYQEEGDIDRMKKMKEDAKVVYIIRHGEKVYDTLNITAYKYACLSEQGWARAYHLNYVFGNVDGHNPDDIQSPDTMFAFNYDNDDLDCRSRAGDKGDRGQRMYRTEGLIAPLGQQLGVTTLNQYGSKPDLCTEAHRGCNTGAAYKIKEALKHGSKSILVSWEHANIVYLVKELGYPGQLPYWPDIQYDIIYALYYDPHTLEFMTIDTDLYQHFHWMGPSVPHHHDQKANMLGEKPGIN